MIDTRTLPVAAASPAGATTVQNPGTLLGRDDFLRLLVTQLRNQDPLDPLDQNEFMAQTAQFASLEQLMAISSSLDELKATSAASGLVQASALLGKRATAAGRDVAFDGVTPAALPFALDRVAGEVSVEVLDAQGRRVRQMSLGPRAAGAQAVEWDGADDQGQRVAPGTYFYRVSAAGEGPEGAPRVTVVEGEVTGFEMLGGRLVLHVGAALVRQEDVVSLLAGPQLVVDEGEAVDSAV
jgi:flagellar basal-body rod modification protein FlgD